MDKYLLAHLIFGSMIFIAALIFKLFPPKKRNSLYGYRTPRSKKSQETWDEANKYSANVLLIVSILTSFTQIITYALVDPKLSLQLSSGVLGIGLVLCIVLTEIQLKRLG